MTSDWLEVTVLPNRKRPILRDIAYQKFMKHLFAGTIKPGQLVSQRELCDALDVPLGPMREALKRLEAENIVTLIAQRGIKILEIDEKVINDTFALRRIVEIEAVRRYVADPNPDAVRSLLARTEEVSRAARAERPDIAGIHDLTSLDHEMHYLFLTALDNDIVNELFRRMLGNLRLSRLIYRLRNHRERDGFLEHLEIMTLVLEGNAEAAARVMGNHLDASWRRALGYA